MITFGEPDPRHPSRAGAAAATNGVNTSTAPLILRQENEASHPEWDGFLAGVRGGDLTQTSWWARIKQASGFEVIRVVARVDGEIVGGAQILARSLGPLGKAAYVPYGPIVVPGTRDEDISKLAWHVRETCRRDRIRAAFVQPPEGGERVAAALRLEGFAASSAGIAPRASLRVDVMMEPPELLVRMVRHTRAHVRRSIRDPLTVRSGTREDLALFHELHCRTAERHGFAPALLRYLELLWDELRPSGLVELLLVHTEGTYLAGLLVTRFGDGITERISGYAPERVPRKKMRPNEALRWAAMLGAREHGDRWYDLGGVEYPVVEALAAGADPATEEMRASRSAHKLGLGGTPLLYPPPLELFPNRVLRGAYRAFGESDPAQRLRQTLQARWRFGSPEHRRTPKLKYLPFNDRSNRGVQSVTGGVATADVPALVTTVEDTRDAPEWDDFLARTPGGDLVQSSAWGRVKQTAGMDVHRVIVRLHGEIVGGAQVLVRPLRPLGYLAYVPYGPLLAVDASEEAGALVDQGLRQLCRGRAIRAMVVQPPEFGERAAAMLRTRGFEPTRVEVAPPATLRVDLQLSADELLARMSKHTRRDFKQSLRGPVSVRFATTRGELRSFHELYCATAARQGFTPWSLRYIESVWDELRPKGQVEVLLADIEGTDVAGNMVTCFGDLVTGRLVGFDPGRLTGRIRPNEALHWAILEWGRERGFRWLDVGGIRRDDALEFLRHGGPVGEQQTLKMRLPGTPLVYPEPLQLIGNPMLRLADRTLGSRQTVHTVRSWVSRRVRQGADGNG